MPPPAKACVQANQRQRRYFRIACRAQCALTRMLEVTTIHGSSLLGGHWRSHDSARPTMLLGGVSFATGPRAVSAVSTLFRHRRNVLGEHAGLCLLFSFFRLLFTFFHIRSRRAAASTIELKFLGIDAHITPPLGRAASGSRARPAPPRTRRYSGSCPVCLINGTRDTQTNARAARRAVSTPTRTFRFPCPYNRSLPLSSGLRCRGAYDQARK